MFVFSFAISPLTDPAKVRSLFPPSISFKFQSFSLTSTPSYTSINARFHPPADASTESSKRRYFYAESVSTPFPFTLMSPNSTVQSASQRIFQKITSFTLRFALEVKRKIKPAREVRLTSASVYRKQPPIPSTSNFLKELAQNLKFRSF